MNKKIYDIYYYSALILCFSPIFSAPIALGSGILFSLIKPKEYTPKLYSTSFSKICLQVAIVLMGFGLNLTKVLESFSQGFLLTSSSVILTISIGLILAKLLKVDKNIGKLISSGTAICGGSAIAAVASVIKPKDYQISFSLTVIFVLNAIALFIFPVIGNYFNMSEQSFGLWCAIAIHDTSSVVGAASTFGDTALDIATTVKLCRALWIIPVSLIFAFFSKKENSQVKIPWFILLFVLAILFSYFIPSWSDTYTHLYWLGKKGMVLALFFIGSSLNRETIVKSGFKPFLLGIILWILISVVSFIVIY